MSWLQNTHSGVKKHPEDVIIQPVTVSKICLEPRLSKLFCAASPHLLSIGPERAPCRLPLSPRRIKVGIRRCLSLPASMVPTGGFELPNKMELPSGCHFCLPQRDRIWWEPETWHWLQFPTSKHFIFCLDRANRGSCIYLRCFLSSRNCLY